MFSTARALLIPVIFLCGLEEVALAQHGHCAADRCFALFLKPANYSAAQRGCQDSGGRLMDAATEHAGEAFASFERAIRGRFWVNDSNRTGTQRRSLVSVTTNGSSTLPAEHDSDTLSGYMCQYTVNEPCSSLRAGSRMSYVAYEGFEVKDSEHFPQGTIATAETPGAEYADSKHVCFMGVWIKAPWSCEVFNGGCEHRCNGTSQTCTCPAGRSLHPNNVTCAKDPRACQKHGGEVAQDGKGCVDADECKQRNPCTRENQECVNEPQGAVCRCIDGFAEEDGVCVNTTICFSCEHRCEKIRGVYECRCLDGFRVSPRNPTDCEEHCAEKDCPARCDPNADKKGQRQCFCPDGYIQDTMDNDTFCTDIDECDNEQCGHRCENSFGSFRCLCEEGYALEDDGYTCLRTDGEAEDAGSGVSPSDPAPADAHAAAVPFYVKTGSVMGIAVFVALGAALLYLLWRSMSKRCGKFELTSLKGPDIFYLQQMSTDTYKRLSFDKPFKNDSQRV
ncbi:thrombomodulin-like [Betta splendens]|uniref:Thrombomodulin n=1 Tax=Betta splendens TaxID=158456 RepID=A0A6P7LSS1_BETSP|nr:thrombomodulin-like [Betta splendens]